MKVSRKNPNPQGKGLVPVLDAWQQAQPKTVVAKDARQILTDYVTALLVLSADFAFKPRPGVPYYLYLRDAAWRLSLISPDEWGGRAPGQCLGECYLQPDMTWELKLTAELGDDPDVQSALCVFRDGFVRLVAGSETLENGLPHYVKSLPYYRRLLAAGLASSLSQSLELGNLKGITSDRWLEVAGSTQLLPHTS